MTADVIVGATLAVDIGGTKTLAGLVANGRVLDSRQQPTARDAGADDWMDATAHLAAAWPGRFARAGVAVTGVVADGLWSPLNPGVLAVPAGFPLVARLERQLQVPVLAVNDAQAAAWGEFRYGAGHGTQSLVFVTVSTGLGGGLVVHGQLVTGRDGLAGSLGQLTAHDPAADRLEDTLSGQWIAGEAARLGHALDAVDVIAAAARGAHWADAIVARSVDRLAAQLADLQYLVDPDRIVIGGGVGLSPYYLAKLRRRMTTMRSHAGTEIVPAALGREAGIVGAADLANEQIHPQRTLSKLTQEERR